MTEAQAKAFILFSENEIRRHEQDINNIKKVLARIRIVFGLEERAEAMNSGEVVGGV
jgi:hypothetical protein